jgi:DNA-binding MarR family transcriptional regulator
LFILQRNYSVVKLEDEIQQKSFKTPKVKLAVNLLYTSNWLNDHYAHFFKGTDLTVQQFNVLRILRGQLPNYCNLKLIKERMLDRSSDASRIVDKLVAKELVVRHHCPSDRRQINLMISERGLTLLTTLDFVDEAPARIFEQLSDEESIQLNQLLDKMRG